MIYDKKKKSCVDTFTDPYFRDYEIAVTVDGIILLLQDGEVVSSADSNRYQADPIEAYDLATNLRINTSTHPDFKDYEIAFGDKNILMLKYGVVECCADSSSYGIRPKKNLDLINIGLLPSEQAVYRYIFSYILKHRYAPTYDEILSNCKIHSKSTVSMYIKKMLNLGILESDAPGSPRALRLPLSA